MLAELLAAYPAHMPLLTEAMTRAEKDAKKEKDNGDGASAAAWGAVIAAANAVLAELDGARIQAALAKRQLPGADDATKKARAVRPTPIAPTGLGSQQPHRTPRPCAYVSVSLRLFALKP